MIIKKIIFENFRPFYGLKEIKLCSGEKNVTLLKAENGAGKSTFLEGIRWCLYKNDNVLNLKCEGKNNSRAIRDGAKSFVNKKALSEISDQDEITASITLFLEKDNNEYKVKRDITFIDNHYIRDDFKILKDGGKVHSPQDLIDEILPQSIDFFVNGERLKKLEDTKESKREVHDSIFRVLGVKTLANAVEDLKSVTNDYYKEYKKENVSAELEKIRKQYDDEKKGFDEEEENYSKIEAEFESLKTVIDRLNDQLYSLPQESEKNSKNREQKSLLENDIKIIKETIKTNTDNYKDKLSKKSCFLLTNEILKKSFEIIDQNRKKGEVPSKYEKEFLNELLIHGKCICGRDLSENSESYKLIEGKILEAATREERNIFNEVHFELQRTLKNVDINNLKDELLEDKVTIALNKEKLEQLTAKYDEAVKDSSDEDLYEEYKKIKKEIEKKNDALSKLVLDLATSNNKIEILKESVGKLQKEVTEKEKKEIKNQVLYNKYMFSLKTTENLKELKRLKEENIRNELQRVISEIYNKINGKIGYKAIIDENFNFMIKDISDGSLASDSTGEERNATLSFIGGLLKLAGELKRNQKKDEINAGGGDYPLILDSPYGVLDNKYRENVSRCIPELSKQVVILVSSGQWSEISEKALGDKIGKKYSLENRRRSGTEEKFDITDIKEEVV